MFVYETSLYKAIFYCNVLIYMNSSLLVSVVSINALQYDSTELYSESVFP